MLKGLSLLFPPKPLEKLWLSDNFRGNKSEAPSQPFFEVRSFNVSEIFFKIFFLCGISERKT